MNEKDRDLEIGLRIKKIRQDRKITQVQLANQIGVSQTAIALWENGNRRIPLEIIDELSLILNISASYLLFGNADFSDNFSPEEVKPSLTAKDERDIKKDLDSLREKLENKEFGPAAYDGEDIPDEDVDLFLGQVELMLRRLKAKNKAKYTPKKYTVEQQSTKAEAPATPDHAPDVSKTDT